MSCYVCPWAGSERLAHEHHIVPQAAGGSDDPTNLIWLCAGCHHNIHAIGYALQHRRRAEAIDLLNQTYTHPPMRKRVHDLAVTAAQELAQNREKPSSHKVLLELTHTEFLAVQALAREQRVSVVNLCLGLVRATVRRTGVSETQRQVGSYKL